MVTNVTKMEAVGKLLCLDTILDEDNRNTMLIVRSLSDEELCNVAALSASRECHIRPTLYSEHWISQYTDSDFKGHFRLSREQFDFLLTNVLPTEVQPRKSWGITPAKAFQMTLWYMATQVNMSLLQAFTTVVFFTYYY